MGTKKLVSSLMRQGWKLLVLAIVVALGLGACGKKDEDGGGSSSENMSEYLPGCWREVSGTWTETKTTTKTGDKNANFNLTEVGTGWLLECEFTNSTIKGNTITFSGYKEVITSSDYKEDRTISGTATIDIINNNYCKIKGDGNKIGKSYTYTCTVDGTFVRLSGTWFDKNLNATLVITAIGDCYLNGELLEVIPDFTKETDNGIEFKIYVSGEDNAEGILSKDANIMMVNKLKGKNYTFKRQ